MESGYFGAASSGCLIKVYGEIGCSSFDFTNDELCLTIEEVQFMSFLAWIVLGLVAGFIASKIVNKKGEGLFLDVVLGIVGAVVGGWLFGIFGANGVTGTNLYSLLVAVAGAIVVLFAYHAIRRAV